MWNEKTVESVIKVGKAVFMIIEGIFTVVKTLRQKKVE